MKSITVYCGSSDHVDEQFHEPAAAIGKALAMRGISLVFGGGRVGLMGVVARAVREHGGHVVGIITTKLHAIERADEQCDELIIVDTMRERKRLLLERGEGIIVLPGGLGTYEEFFEVLVGRQLGEHDHPIGIVNAHGYYNPLVAMLEHGIEHGFVREAARELFEIHPNATAVLDRVLQAEKLEIDDHRFLPSVAD